MRRDRQLFEAIDYDRENERNQSGCCVRLDESGCVQGPDEQNCKVCLAISLPLLPSIPHSLFLLHHRVH